MKLIGITGGVGMGKSTAQTLLVARSIPIIDTDELARLLVEPGQPALAEIVAQFGKQFLDQDGRLRREALATLVFKDTQARGRLESILHPRIRASWTKQVEQWRQDGVALGTVVIPLLFETGAAPGFDRTVCVACSPQTQVRRLRERGWTDAQIQQRIAAQWPIERKLEASDCVVWTEGTLEVHAQQWDEILRRVVSPQ